MGEITDILNSIKLSCRKRILYLPHAIRQMTRPDRMISTSEIRSVIEHGEIIEDYPNDSRGHSCLILGFGNDDRTIHVACSPKEDYLSIITAYIPNVEKWDNNYKVRR